MHVLGNGFFGVTDDYAPWYAGQARLDFRVSILRETRPPKSARARAAARTTLTLLRANRSAGAPVQPPAGPPRTARRP
ncbi:hypothetical protein ACFVH7_12465 [Kitasatospora indigofera]|uniref:hypothetical protein n=1 Tax=Kitasatospora indigofera TaxID=67307 RepID=UPI003640E2CB